MEKILRKISCKDRLPEKEGWYAVESSSGMHGVYWDNDWNQEDFNTLKIEYWYEEVEVCELEDFKVAIGNLKMINDMDNYKAKERYEKAYDFMIDNDKYTIEGKATTLEDFKKALRIAAGLDE